MTGLPDWNKKQFAQAEEALYEMGASFVFNPTVTAPKEEEAKPHEYYMCLDLHELTQNYNGKPIYDVIALLPNWRQSEGARVEFIVAVTCGLKVLEL